MALGDEGPHAGRLGERRWLTVVDFSACGIELVGMRRDVPEQMLRMGRKPGLPR